MRLAHDALQLLRFPQNRLPILVVFEQLKTAQHDEAVARPGERDVQTLGTPDEPNLRSTDAAHQDDTFLPALKIFHRTNLDVPELIGRRGVLHLG